jgi:cobalt-zinc-cadmium efflux system membrane fusion protein
VSDNYMNDPRPTAPPDVPDAPHAEPPAIGAPDLPTQRPGLIRRLVNLLILLVVLLLLVVAGGAWIGVLHIPGLSDEKAEEGDAPPKPLSVDLLDRPQYTLAVPVSVRDTLGLRKDGKEQVAVAQPPTKGHPLVLPGSTALDPARLLRIRARFAPAEVVKIGQVRDRWQGRSEFRELRSGDTVSRGDLLGVFYSVDVGNKKNDLYDAIIQLKLDEEILERAEAARGSVPEIYILNARRNVLGDRNAISRAENTLRAWNISQEEIDTVRREAEQADLDTIKLEKTKKTKKEKDRARDEAKRKQLDRWARVELKAPFDATIIERNVAEHEIVVDGTTNLFVLARVEQIAVIANAPEDDLPTLHKLTYPQRRWTVRTVGAPDDKGIEGPIDEIGYIIDPNQHTAVVKGYIANPGNRLRGGQFVTVTIDLPPPPDVVEIPMSAIVDDGKQCVVFIQPDPKRPHYTMRRVLVTHRFDSTAWVLSKLKPEQQVLKPEENEQGLLVPQPLHSGDRVILSGVLELKKEVEDREASKQLQRAQQAAKKAAPGPATTAEGI